MCRPVSCKVCSKTTWAGCGQHVAAVKAGVPADQWCGGEHTDAERAAGTGDGLGASVEAPTAGAGGTAGQDAPWGGGSVPIPDAVELAGVEEPGYVDSVDAGSVPITDAIERAGMGEPWVDDAPPAQPPVGPPPLRPVEPAPLADDRRWGWRGGRR